MSTILIFFEKLDCYRIIILYKFPSFNLTIFNVRSQCWC